MQNSTPIYTPNDNPKSGQGACPQASNQGEAIRYHRQLPGTLRFRTITHLGPCSQNKAECSWLDTQSRMQLPDQMGSFLPTPLTDYRSKPCTGKVEHEIFHPH